MNNNNSEIISAMVSALSAFLKKDRIEDAKILLTEMSFEFIAQGADAAIDMLHVTNVVEYDAENNTVKGLNGTRDLNELYLLHIQHMKDNKGK